MVSPIFFTACNNENEVGRDRNVPNSIEDNYTGDADRNKVGENEEEVNRKANEMSTSAGNQMRRAENAMSNAVTMDKTYTAAEYNDLQERLTKLEKDVMDLKSKNVGPDIVGQK
ncbi:hypothetical protein EON78_05340 [bacterium]|nr:MAG: hypothetical protein EON78_05340 [bacterium]